MPQNRAQAQQGQARCVATLCGHHSNGHKQDACAILGSSIQHPASSIQHPASSIQHPASSIQHPASGSRNPLQLCQGLIPFALTEGPASSTGRFTLAPSGYFLFVLIKKKPCVASATQGLRMGIHLSLNCKRCFVGIS